MRLENSSESDQVLHEALSEWQVKEALPPRFREQVWQRIAREEGEAPWYLRTHLLGRIGTAMMRPSLAISYVTGLLLIGLLAGYWQAREENARTSRELGARYVQMMAPYQALQR